MPTRPKLEITTWDGFPEGMNVAEPAHEIKDTQARYLQDVWVFRTSFTERRGPLTAVPNVVTFSNPIVGATWTLDPTGTVKIAVFTVNGTSLIMSVLSSDYTTKTDHTLTGTWSIAPYPIFQSSPLMGGGVTIGVATSDGVSPTSQVLVLWRGATVAQYNPANVSVTQASKAVTGVGTTFTTTVSPGSYMFTSGGTEHVGVVASITSDTALTLEEPALHAVSAAGARFEPYTGWYPRIQKGVASVTAGGTALTGANTKWKDQNVASGYRVYRASDNLLVGTISAVASNVAATISAAAVALVEDDYFMIGAAPDHTISTLGTAPKMGFLSANYAELQWYLNRGITADQSGEFVNRLYFTGPEDLRAVDLSVIDGDYIPIVSGKEADTGAKAIIPAYNSLMILKEREAFALFGQNTDQFQVKKIGDDGCLSAMSVVPYESGVIWAGRTGIYLWDGVEATNLVEGNLGQYYPALVKNFDPNTYRIWAVIHRDHYILFFESVTPNVAVIKGTVASTPSRLSISIFLPRNAITTFTNIDIRGSIIVPSTLGSRSWIAVNTSSGGRLASLDDLFDLTGNDTLTCTGSTIGPDLYIESKKYNVGNALLKKLWKQLMLHYFAGGDSLKLDTIVGLNTIGATTTSVWPVTVYTWNTLSTAYLTWDALESSYPTWQSITNAIFFVRRLKFLKRSQHFAFRIYQNSSAVTSAKLGPFALGYKKQRAGRI